MKRIVGIFVVCCVLILPSPGVPQSPSSTNLLKPPFVPTPMKDVRQMLRMADVGPEDMLYDLGSGDGRIPITAVQEFGVKEAVGIDIDPSLVRLSTKNAREAGIAERVRFYRGDVFKADFSKATVVTLYLLQEVNLALRPRLLEELRPGTRLVSYEFDLGDWNPDAVYPEEGTAWEKTFVDIDEAPPHIYFWVVPVRVEGMWDVTFGDVRGRLLLTQHYQELTGEFRSGQHVAEIPEGRIDGKRIRFVIPEYPMSHIPESRIEARVTADGMEGVATTPAGETYRFRASEEE